MSVILTVNDVNNIYLNDNEDSLNASSYHDKPSKYLNYTSKWNMNNDSLSDEKLLKDIEIKESKINIENQSIKRLQNSIVKNIQDENNHIKTNYYDNVDIWKGNKTCLKDMKIIEHLRAVDSILEWIFENANLLALINIWVFFLILCITYKGSETPIKNTASHSDIDEIQSHDYTEISKDDPQLIKAPRSARLKAMQNLEIDSEFNLEKSEKSHVESFLEHPRRISSNSIVNVSKFASSEDLLKAWKVKHKQFSPKPESIREFKISYTPSFARQFKSKQIIDDEINSPIIEEKSWSVSPNTSFRKLKSAFAKTRELQLHEEYIKTEEGIVEIKTQKWVTIFEPNPRLDTLVTEYVNKQDPANQIDNNQSSYHSFKNLNQFNFDQKEWKEDNFEDQNFKDFTKKLNPK